MTQTVVMKKHLIMAEVRTLDILNVTQPKFSQIASQCLSYYIV